MRAGRLELPSAAWKAAVLASRRCQHTFYAMQFSKNPSKPHLPAGKNLLPIWRPWKDSNLPSSILETKHRPAARPIRVQRPPPASTSTAIASRSAHPAPGAARVVPASSCNADACSCSPRQLEPATGFAPAQCCLQNSCPSPRAPPAELRAILEIATSRIPTVCAATCAIAAFRPANNRVRTGAVDRARTGTFSLTRGAHCHSCSDSKYGGSTGNRTPLCRETTGRPADERWNQWLRGRESNPQRVAYETTELPLFYPATLHADEREPAARAVVVWWERDLEETELQPCGDYVRSQSGFPIAFAGLCHMNGVAWLMFGDMT